MRDLMNENEPKRLNGRKKTIHTRIESIKTLRRNSRREWIYRKIRGSWHQLNYNFRSVVDSLRLVLWWMTSRHSLQFVSYFSFSWNSRLDFQEMRVFINLKIEKRQLKRLNHSVAPSFFSRTFVPNVFFLSGSTRPNAAHRSLFCKLGWDSMENLSTVRNLLKTQWTARSVAYRNFRFNFIILSPFTSPSVSRLRQKYQFFWVEVRILRCARTPKIEICRLRKCNRAISCEKCRFQSMPEHASMNPYKYYALCKCKQNVQLASTVRVMRAAVPISLRLPFEWGFRAVFRVHCILRWNIFMRVFWTIESISWCILFPCFIWPFFWKIQPSSSMLRSLHSKSVQHNNNDV